MTQLPDILLHLDAWLQQIASLHPVGAYALLFAIVLLESAFFPAAPFLPGDGLLFAAGVLAASGALHLGIAVPVLIAGGVLGNWIAYRVGKGIELTLFERSRWFNRNHYEQANAFYQSHGDKALFLSRFIPVVRSLVPLVAGVARMDFRSFMKFNVLSVILWVLSIVLITYYLGHLPVVQQHFTWIVFGMAALGVLSMVIAGIRWAVGRSLPHNQ